MTRLSATSSLLPAVLLAGCVTAGKGMEPAAPITPVIDPGARKAALARLPATERRRYCLGMVRHAALSAEAWITGPIRRQQSNAQSAGNAILETVEGWYAGHPRASEYIRNTLEEGARIGAFTKILPYSPAEYTNYNPINEAFFRSATSCLPSRTAMRS